MQLPVFKLSRRSPTHPPAEQPAQEERRHGERQQEEEVAPLRTPLNRSIEILEGLDWQHLDGLAIQLQPLNEQGLTLGLQAHVGVLMNVPQTRDPLPAACGRVVDERRAQGEPMSMFIEREEPDHPWLPGLEAYREAHDIGYSDEEKRKRTRKRRKDAKARGEEKPRHPSAGWGDDLDPAPELESDPADMYSER